MSNGSTPKKQYDFIICGSGPAACALAGRLAADSRVSILLVEAGPFVRDERTDVSRAWPSNVGSERDWRFKSEPEPGLDGRVIDYSMGRLVGGGSSINASVWARGHKQDWDHVADVARDPAWGYEAILSIYRRIEDYLGAHDERYHGRGGPITVAPGIAASDMRSPGLCTGFMAAAAGLGVPVFPEQNGALQEASAGVSVTDLAVHGGMRSSVIDGYLSKGLAQGNLEIAAHTLVTKVRLRDGRAVGVEVVVDGSTVFVEAACEVIVAAGAIQTPKLLMQSGIGDPVDLKKAGIQCVAPLPGVGQNLQDHPLVSLAWSTPSVSTVSASAQAVAFLNLGKAGPAPDVYLLATEIPTAPGAAQAGVSWAIGAALLAPASRGTVRVVDANPNTPALIQGNYLTEPEDLAILSRALEFAGDIGASSALSGMTANVISAPGNDGHEAFIRARTRSGWHLCGTCRMGEDEQAVVDNQLRVRGVSHLRVCDTSVLPAVTRGNTMAPALVIGERLADILAPQ
jgi:choline dehydrogenase